MGFFKILSFLAAAALTSVQLRNTKVASSFDTEHESRGADLSDMDLIFCNTWQRTGYLKSLAAF